MVVIYLRLNGNWRIAISAGWWMLQCRQFGMNVAIQFVIQIEVALIFQRCATCGTLEAFHVQILILNANKYATGNCSKNTQKHVLYIDIVDYSQEIHFGMTNKSITNNNNK